MTARRTHGFCSDGRHWVPVSTMARGKNTCKECRADYQRMHRARVRVRDRNEALRWPRVVV